MATPHPSRAPTEPFRLTSSDGLCLACALRDSHGPTRAVLQIAHGMGEHMGRDAGLRDIACDFYPGGRHEMLNEINGRDVQTRLLDWISQLAEKLDGDRSPVSIMPELQR